MEERQEGLTKAQIAKELDITVRTLDRKRREGKIILTPHGKNRYMYTVKEETTAEPQERQEQEPQEAVTDQTTALQSLLQSFRHSFRNALDQDLDFIDEQIAQLHKRANEQDAQRAEQDKCTDERLAALEDRIAKLQAHTDQRLDKLDKCIEILGRIIRQHAEVGHQESK